MNTRGKMNTHGRIRNHVENDTCFYLQQEQIIQLSSSEDELMKASSQSAIKVRTIIHVLKNHVLQNPHVWKISCSKTTCLNAHVFLQVSSDSDDIKILSGAEMDLDDDEDAEDPNNSGKSH